MLKHDDKGFLFLPPLIIPVDETTEMGPLSSIARPLTPPPTLVLQNTPTRQHTSFIVIEEDTLQINMGFVIINTPVVRFKTSFLWWNLTVGEITVPVKFATGITAFVFVRPVSPPQRPSFANSVF